MLLTALTTSACEFVFILLRGENKFFNTRIAFFANADLFNRVHKLLHDFKYVCFN